MNDSLSLVLTGVGATMLMDVWGVARKYLFGLPSPDYGMVGRWIGHMTHGKFRHDRIAAASPIAAERVIGWSSHYIIGIAFAAGLISIVGSEWLRRPTLGPALAFGVATVAAPFFLMQPGMGAGIAASRTPKPGSARLQSLITHAIFGFGLWTAACVTYYLGQH
ncbi:DUF2938 domain-containing protein [Steroidobacter cummioxidans]|uniref:DUF2938 domain-containing protein n=1 Tax=Steroidobacter cummioxidans TaxID=1803913 RepID=UPI000E314AA4|nr:DUF2938 domain-containing protein [Steroidobacter cummioxidans]